MLIEIQSPGQTSADPVCFPQIEDKKPLRAVA